MANEFKIRKGLIVEGATSGTVVDVQGSLGQLFSVTDNLTGEIFAVADISGVPIMSINSNGKVGIGTTSGAFPLNVVNSSTAYVFSETTGAATSSGYRWKTTDSEFAWFSTSGTNALNLYDYEANATRMVISSAGALRLNAYGAGILISDASGNITTYGGTTPPSGVGAAGRVAIWDNGTEIGSDTNLNWDFTNDRLGIGVTGPAAKLHIEGTGDLVRLVSTNAGSGGAQMDMLHFSASPADDDIMGFINMGGYYSGTNSAYFSSIRTVATDVSARKGALTFFTRSEGDFIEKMRIDSAGALQLNAYNSTNNTGTPTYLLGTDAFGNVVKTNSVPSPITSQADSLYDLIPNGAFTTTYAFTSTAGTYSEVMSGDDVITDTGTYTVQAVVNDFAVGGTQYDVRYSGIMSWHAGSTNDTGQGTQSEIVLHRNGHASNQGIIYLRTRETNASESSELRLEIMCNRTYTGASNVIFKFVRVNIIWHQE